LGSSGSYEDLFLANLGLVDDVVRFIARCHRLTPTDAEEFASLAQLKLIENDYGVFRAFKGQSKLRTYLVAVLTHLFLDDRTARWGRWRPSAAAKRLGATALLLERLVYRDGLDHESAVEVVRTNHHAPESVAALHAILAKLPQRTSRRPSDEEPADPPDPSPGADEAVFASELAEDGGRVRAALERALAALDPRERLILRMRFEDGRTGKEIGAAVGEDEARIFRTIEKLTKRLRKSMESEGIDARAVAELLDHDGLEGRVPEFRRPVSLKR
jgi:RNA polymerase sigma factor (sigma-70 family)